MAENTAKTDQPRQPPGIPVGGRFAPGTQGRADITLGGGQPPYGHDHPWNADPVRRAESEEELAGQLAATGWGQSDPRQLARGIYREVSMRRGTPYEEWAGEGAASDEAVERADDALWEHDRDHPDSSPELRGHVAYRAMLAVIEDQRRRRYTPTGFSSRRP